MYAYMELTILFLQVLILLLISGTCSGLNITLMALDADNLRHKAHSGNQDAQRILGLRETYT